MRNWWILLVLVLIAPTLQAYTLAEATDDDAILKLLTSPIGVVYDRSEELKEPRCLIDHYPSRLAAYTAVGFKLVKVTFDRNEWLMRDKPNSAPYWQERLSLIFDFEKTDSVWQSRKEKRQTELPNQ